MNNLDSFFNIVTKFWPYKRGLFALILTAILIELSVFAITKVDLINMVIVIVFTITIIFSIWLYTRRIPKTKKNKVGFVVSVTCDDEEEAKKIRQDFILTLRRLVKVGEVGHSFQFIELPRHIAENVIDSDDAQKIRIKAKAHFFLHGRVRIGNIKNKEHHFLELDGIVTHKPISIDVSKKLSNEFIELLPRKVIIAKENDLLEFQIASEWSEIVAKYIIGIAAALSGDLLYAENLYQDAYDRLHSIKHEIPAFIKLKERIPLRLFEIYEVRAQAAYEKWASTHDDHYLSELGDNLKKIGDNNYNKSSILFLTAIYEFLFNKDVSKSLDALNKCTKQNRNAAWHFNVGFLYAYKGDLKSAIRHYRSALELPIYPDLISKIEDFLEYIVCRENDMYQLYYCLGFFNREVKGDNDQATKDFLYFLESGDNNDYPKERELARKWLNEISTQNVQN